jgi:hypothetical protein
MCFTTNVLVKEGFFSGGFFVILLQFFFFFFVSHAAVLQYLITCNLDLGFLPCLIISVAPHLCFGLERERHRHRETDREGLQQVYFVVDCD